MYNVSKVGQGHITSKQHLKLTLNFHFDFVSDLCDLDETFKDIHSQ